MNDSVAARAEAYRKNKLVNDAILFAVQAHADAFRKGTEIPYIMHPVEVAAIAAGLLTYDGVRKRLTGEPNEVIAAAVLHDTVEDTPTTKEQLIVAFGSTVADLVALESENKREDRPAQDTWSVRKQETIDHLSQCADIRVKVIAFADKLANLRAINRDYMISGDRVWERFNQTDPKKHGWYYKSIFDACPELQGTAAYREYELLLEKNFFGL